MRRKLVFLACLSCLWAAAGDDFEIKVYTAAPTATATDVDGKLDEPAWREAVSVGGFTLYGKPTLAEPPTFWKATYDDQFLYLGVSCDEPALAKLQPVPQARDAHGVFGGEAVEIFLDPGHSHSIYYQFGIDAAGSLYDSRGEDPVWNAAVKVATGRTALGWTVEFAVPWADLKATPAPGLLLGINVCRDRQLDGKQWTNWARTSEGFHDPIRFGHLILSPPAGLLETLGPELRQGDRVGPIVLFSQAGFRDATYRGLLHASLARVTAQLAALEEMARGERNGPVQDELAKATAAYRQRLEPMRTAVAGLREVGAEEYTRLDLALTKFGGELGQAVWNARLQALLNGI